MEPKTIIAIAAGVLAVPFIILFFKRLKQNQDEINALIERKFGRKHVVLREPHAFLVAQQSRGYSQRQGAGNLILTEDELFLALAMPKNIFSIPLENVGEMEIVSRMCAKQKLGKIFKIHYTDDLGHDDAIGLMLKGKDVWEAEIRRLQSRSGSRTGVYA